MILCNLAAIMGERRLKISKVAADTGISRTTLTALYYDSGKGVQFDTANLLCIYFGISMGELFTTLPFDLFVENCSFVRDSSLAIFNCKILTQKEVQFPELRAKVYFPNTKEIRSHYVTQIKFSERQHNNSEDEIRLLNDVFARLTNAAKIVIEGRLSEALRTEFGSKGVIPGGKLGDFLFSTQDYEFPDRFLGATEN